MQNRNRLTNESKETIQQIKKTMKERYRIELQNPEIIEAALKHYNNHIIEKKASLA